MRHGPGVNDRVCAGDKCERRNDHLGARLDAYDVQRDLQRHRPA